jgi:glycosyltransferase involved in cell wall biosynthesis
MSRLGERGRRVFWVAPWFRGAGPPVDVQPLAPGVWQLSLRGPDVDVYGAAPTEAAVDAIVSGLVDLAREVDVARAIQIVELPFWWPVARRLRERPGWPLVYDCMDDHAGFSFHSAEATALETGLIQGAEVVLASSRPLQAKIARSNREAVLLRNACDYEHFSTVTRQRSDRPVIGYYGAIADWFDSDLVADLAERQPGWDFVLVGSTFSADVTRLRSLPNVQLAGERPYAELPRWLSRFDVTLLPFRRTPLTEATNPVKAYEIMAAGLPLVSVPLPEILEFGDLVRLASTPADFERQIQATLADRDKALVERRRAFARQQTWDERIRILEEVIPGLRKTDAV